MATSQDKGWAWIILISGFFSSVIFDGIIYSAGVFLIELLDFYDEGRSTTAWVGSTLVAVAHLAGPLASSVVNRWGFLKGTVMGSILAAGGFFVTPYSSRIWMVILSFGVVGGVGFSLMYLSAYVTISLWFEKRRALATGLVSCGSGVGAFIMAPLTHVLIESYGWKGAMWVIAGLTLNGIPIGFTYMRMQHTPEKHEATGSRTSLRSPSFVLLCSSYFLANTVFLIPFLYLPDVALSLGISKERGSLLVSVIGVANIVGRVAAGIVGDRPWGNPMVINIASLVITGAANIARVWMRSYATLMVYAAILGLSIGAHVAITTVILVKLAGCPNLHTSFGIVNCVRGIGILVGPSFSGYLHDVNKGYDLVFYTAGGVFIVSGLLVIPLMSTESFKCRLSQPWNPEVQSSTNNAMGTSGEVESGVSRALYTSSSLAGGETVTEEVAEVTETYL